MSDPSSPRGRERIHFSGSPAGFHDTDPPPFIRRLWRAGALLFILIPLQMALLIAAGYYFESWFFYFAAGWISLGVILNIPFFVQWTKCHILQLEERSGSIFLHFTIYNQESRIEIPREQFEFELKRGRSRGVLLELWIRDGKDFEIRVTDRGGFHRKDIRRMVELLAKITARPLREQELKLMKGGWGMLFTFNR